jgi:hypothetical protein
MLPLRVVPRITYRNRLLIPPTLYPTLKVPANVPAYEPILLTAGQMSKEAPERVPAPAGLTRSEFDVESPAVQPTGRGQGQYRFVGGDIILHIEVAVFMIDKYRQVPQLFELIMNHELLHVRDTLSLANVEMAKKLRDDQPLRRYLEGTSWSGSVFFDRIRRIWDEQGRALGARLDSGAEYEIYRRKITALLPRGAHL